MKYDDVINKISIFKIKLIETKWKIHQRATMNHGQMLLHKPGMGLLQYT